MCAGEKKYLSIADVPQNRYPASYTSPHKHVGHTLVNVDLSIRWAMGSSSSFLHKHFDIKLLHEGIDTWNLRKTTLLKKTTNENSGRSKI